MRSRRPGYACQVRPVGSGLCRTHCCLAGEIVLREIPDWRASLLERRGSTSAWIPVPISRCSTTSRIDFTKVIREHLVVFLVIAFIYDRPAKFCQIKRKK